MKTMGNEQKAKQIARGLAASDEYPHDYLSAYTAAMQAMELKDKEWVERFKKAFEGLWRASFNIDCQLSKTTTTIEFEHVERE